MADTDSMFSAYGSIFDAATADNVGVRDRALQVAQLQPGRATVYGAHQAGGMLMQNLAGMAGMKTAEQQKAETITNIMKESAGLDPNDPQSARLLAQKFIQAGLPGIGQKFIDKARTLDVKNQELALTEREIVARESDAAVNVAAQEQSAYEFDKTHALANSKFENLIFQQERDFGLRATDQEMQQARDDYTKVQDGILNEIRKGELDIAKARSALERNDFEWRQARVEVTDAQWQKDYDIKKLLADADVAYKTEQTLGAEGSRLLMEVQKEGVALDNRLKELNLTMPADGEFVKLRIGDNDVLHRFNPDKVNEDGTKGGYDSVTDPATLISGEYGMSSKEQNVYDNLWDQYKQAYHTGGSMFEEANWKEGYPDFEDWARDNAGEAGYNIVIKGQGGIRGDYLEKLKNDYNNSKESGNNGETVAVVVDVPDAVQGEAENVTKVISVPYEEIASNENISIKTLKERPKEINGVENNLTNGQYITQLVQEGKEAEAVTYLESLAKSKSSTLDTKMSEMEGFETKLVPWLGKADPPQEDIDSGKYVQQNGKWFIRKGV